MLSATRRAWTVWTANVVCGLSLVAWVGCTPPTPTLPVATPTTPPVATPPTPPKPGATVAGPPLPAAGTYLGAKSCRKCHFKTSRSWKKTGMANAFVALLPGERAEAKKSVGLDPAKDYSRDAACLPCHVTGYGRDGGYPSGDDASETAVALRRDRQGVQCESCHGPGGAYNPIMKANKAYAKAAVLGAGLVEPDEALCLACHAHPSNPFHERAKTFRYKELKGEGTHEHQPLKHAH